MLTKDKVLEVLAKVNDPELNRSLTDLKMVRDVKIQGGNVEVIIALTVPNCPMKSKIESDVQTAVAALPDVKNVSVVMTAMSEEERKALFGEPQQGAALPYNHIKHVVAVMSGKGGVGKSLVTGLLATALTHECYKVGILDADVTGPSIPMLFGLHGPVEPGPVGIRPLQSLMGIKVISMNLLLATEDQPVIWRGPLVGKAITQLWGDVLWGELDYLLVDLPPGTSDASLTTMQSLPVSGIIMVTTPQSLASMVVRKAVHMAQAVKTPIIGVVENMAYFTCPETGTRHYIFGPSHASEVALAATAPLLAQLPIDPQVAALCDAGRIEEVDLEEIPAFLDSFIDIPEVHLEDQALGGRHLSIKARQLVSSKENVGSLANPDGRGNIRGECGDSMQIDLRLQGDIIQEARYSTDGCGATIACGGMVTRMVRSMSLKDAEKITAEELIAALDGLPKEHEHCAKLAVDTLHAAVKNAMNARG